VDIYLHFIEDKTLKNVGPVVAWNITKRCNFKCKHCYSSATANTDKEELTLPQIKGIVDQMKQLKVPVILLSGGEPLMHDDIFEIIAYIREAGIRVSLSTNGSLVTTETALRLKKLGVGYVGISLDGLGTVNDSFRGVKGAYKAAVEGIWNCHEVGQKVGLRMTVHRDNVSEVPKILDFMEKEEINRVCFYHLVPSGRGSLIKDRRMTHKEARDFMSYLMDYTLSSRDQNIKREILTVANHADGPYTYLMAQKKSHELADSVMNKLQNNRGNRSGIAIMNMDWHGDVFPDQFSRFMPLGNALNH
jgi:MoaA/NifB/PqqE/SkfB family radical SAM enzyme